MTPERLEEMKRRQLDMLTIKQKKATKFEVLSESDSIIYEFCGSLIEIVTAAMTGLHELEQKFPEAKEIINTAFEGYKLFREGNKE